MYSFGMSEVAPLYVSGDLYNDQLCGLNSLCFPGDAADFDREAIGVVCF